MMIFNAKTKGILMRYVSSFFLCLLAGLFFSPPSRAADDKQDFGAIEKSVEVGYKGVASRLSVEGRKDFERGHLEWLQFVRKFCAEENLHWHYKNTQDCLSKKYEERENSFKNALYTTPEGLVIRRAESFDTHILDAPDYTDDQTGRIYKLWPSETQVYWPQIDNPSTEAHHLWNSFIKSKISTDAIVEDTPCDLSLDYKILFTRPDFISVEMTDWRYCQGTAHGFGGTYARNRVLSLNRDLMASDIFDKKSEWKGSFRQLVVSGLKDKGEGFQYQPYVMKWMTNPKSWRFTAEGIIVNLGAIDGYAGGEVKSFISWKDLRPLMRKDSIFINTGN